MARQVLSKQSVSKKETQLNLRAIASQVVDAVVSDQQSLNTLLPAALERVPVKDKGLLQEIVFGTCRWYFELERIHDQFLKKRLHRNDQRVSTLLKLGCYQLLAMRIPSHAAIHETVEAAKQLGFEKFSGLINAILRKVSKLQSFDSDLDASAYAQSHPIWMREKVSHNWPDYADEIFKQNNLHPPMTLRVNRLQSSREDYLARLKAADIEAIPCDHAPYGITLDSAVNVSELPHFADGMASVQDEAAQLCTTLLDLQAGEHVLDACAAPGGKTCAILEAQEGLSLTALDIDAHRSERIHDNLKRLNLSAKTVVAEAEQLDTWWDKQPFDKILLDAPCSATGVIRRHPDIKLLRKQDDIKQLAEVQLHLLKTLWETLKEGGLLVYATCSIFPQENSRIIERFLKQESAASLVNIDSDWGVDTGFGKQLFPTQHGHDGFFYACLRKNGKQ